VGVQGLDLSPQGGYRQIIRGTHFVDLPLARPALRERWNAVNQVQRVREPD
jgi:hypothetical protein